MNAAARSTVLDLFTNGLDPEAVQIEDQPVVNLDRHDFAERRDQRILRRVLEAEQLLAERIKPGQRHAIGWALVAIGVVTTIPLALMVFNRRKRLPG
ncbi:MAG: hypothetical protein ABI702_17720 [Burkholderiales bacterium]